MRSLFLDLDGVFADFDGAFPQMFGFDHRDVPDEVMWKAINDYGTYFRDLPVCEGALEFFAGVNLIGPIEGPTILTACPQDNFMDVALQKRGWIREHLGTGVPIIFTPGSKAKPLYLRRAGDILVDDFQANVTRWNKAGGVGILHEGDFAKTYATLLRTIWPNKNPSASGTSPARSADRETTSRATTTATATASDADTTSPAPRVLCPSEAAAHAQD